MKKDEALATLNKAIALEPNNPLCKFHRASALAAANRHTEALTELDELKELVPKESFVFYLAGKVGNLNSCSKQKYIFNSEIKLKK